MVEEVKDNRRFIEFVLPRLHNEIKVSNEHFCLEKINLNLMCLPNLNSTFCFILFIFL